MTQCYDVHLENPQPYTLSQMVRTLEEDGLIAYPVDSYHALGCVLDNGPGIERVRQIRQLGDRHHFVPAISKLSQLGAFVEMDDWVSRVAKATTPGSYAFILKATREMPEMMQYPEKRMIGVWIPDHRITFTLLDVVGSPLVSSTLPLPDHPEPLVEGWTIKELLDHELDMVLNSGDCGLTLTTVINLSDDEPEIVRVGVGGPGPFE